MTAHGMAGDAERFLAAGMDGYVSKPIQLGILRAEIDRLTQSKITNEGGRMQEEMKAPENCRVNLTELLARVDNDRELLSELVSIFKEEFPRYMSTLEEAVGRKNIGEVGSVSHTLKGMLSNLAVASAAASAGRLEQLARSGDVALLHDAFLTFERDVHGLLPEMESYVAKARR